MIPQATRFVHGPALRLETLNQIFDCASKAVVAGYKVEKSELEARTGYRLIDAQSAPLPL
jgi:hypothetical protein